MRGFAWILGTCLLLAGSASAQSITTLSADDSGLELTGPKGGQEEVDSSEKRPVYEKKVGGIVWLEATAGAWSPPPACIRNSAALPPPYWAARRPRRHFCYAWKNLPPLSGWWWWPR